MARALKTRQLRLVQNAHPRNRRGDVEEASGQRIYCHSDSDIEPSWTPSLGICGTGPARWPGRLGLLN